MIVTAGINAGVPPSGAGCAECEATGGWWVHLRRCAGCGHVGCCDTSPSQHATLHWRTTGHPVVQSFEPRRRVVLELPDSGSLRRSETTPPTHHPLSQPVPGPAGRVPADWQLHIH